MIEEIRILVTLEHIAKPSGPFLLGMNISVATKGIASDEEKARLAGVMQPWRWEWINQVHVLDQGPTASNPSPVPVSLTDFRFCNATVDTGHFAAFRTSLAEALQGEYSTRMPRLHWEFGSGRRQTTGLKENFSWHTRLGQVSRMPAPTPHVLNLATLFYVDPANLPQFSAGGHVVAAPTLQSRSDDPIFPGVLRPVGNPAVIDTGHTRVWRWEYGGQVEGLPVAAVVMSTPYRGAAPTTAKYFDMHSRWVGKPGDEAFAEEWRAHLEDRVANALDIGARVLEVAPTLRASGSWRFELARVRLAVLGSLRDFAGIGARKPPGARSMIDVLLASIGKAPLNAQQQALIANRVSAEFDTVQKWADFLRETLPQLNGSTILREKVASSAVDIVEYKRGLGELEQIRQTVFTQENLETLLRAQWRRIAAGQEDLAVLVTLANAPSLPIVDPRRQLALENLWVYWCDYLKKVAIEDPTQPPKPDRERLQLRFVDLFYSYFRDRFQSLLSFQGCNPLHAINGSTWLALLPHIGLSDLNGIDQPDGDLAAALCLHLATWLPETYRRIVPDAEGCTVQLKKASSLPRVPSTESAHAITLQVGELKQLPKGPDEKNEVDADFLDHVSGVAVLMREVRTGGGNRGWKCLNFGRPIVRTSSPTAEPCSADVLMVVPMPIVYQNDLPNAFVSYNNHPLSAKSPAAWFGRELGVSSAESVDSSGNEVAAVALGPLLSYNYPGMPEGICSPTPPSSCEQGKRVNLPGLKYGRDYQFLPFLLTNTGALPNALATASPIEMDSLASFEVPATIQDRVRCLKYLRRTFVGALRIVQRKVSEPGAPQKLQVPPVPEGVASLVRDMSDDISLNSAPWIQSARDVPLVLLTPSTWPGSEIHHSFHFRVRKPAVDINVWDRWVSGGPTPKTKAERVAIWADLHCKLRENNAKEEAATDVDVSLDDPAVSNTLIAKLTVLGETRTIPRRPDDDPMTARVSYPAVVYDPDGPAPSPIQLERRESIGITCKIVPRTDELDDDEVPEGLDDSVPGALTVNLLEGKSYRLTLWSAVDSHSYEQRFDSICDESKIGHDGDYVLMSPFDVFLECATGTIVENQVVIFKTSDPEEIKIQDLEQQIYNWLSPRFEITPGRTDSLEVRLRDTSGGGTTPAPDVQFKFVKNIDLLRQTWRWQGRPTAQHPRIAGIAASGIDAAEDEWEEIEFGNRPDTDHLRVAMKPTILPSGNRTFSYSEVLVDYTKAGVDGTSAQGADLRAMHYRFSAVLHSRYAPLIPEGPVLRRSVHAKDFTGLPTQRAEQDPRTIWQSVFVPCRKTGTIDPPTVRFILPLTENYGAGRDCGAACALGVFSGPWHDVGGICERLESEVVQVVGPGTNPVMYYEAGPEPLFDVQPGLRALSTSSSDTVSIQNIEGPFGHTRDLSGDSARFGATSFIIPPPTVMLGAGSTAPVYEPRWSFAKVKFRRVLDLGLDQNGVMQQRSSDWTQAFWIQYLPEFSIVSAEHEQPSDLYFTVTPNLRQLTVRSRHTQAMAPLLPVLPDAQTNFMFERYLVLTRVITDFTGRKGQETYVGTFARSTGGTWSAMRPAAAGPPIEDAQYLVRIVDTQQRSENWPQQGAPFANEDDLWRSMFDEEKPDLQRARIVGVSEPIKQQPVARSATGGSK